jgi:hypothetical protein
MAYPSFGHGFHPTFLRRATPGKRRSCCRSFRPSLSCLDSGSVRTVPVKTPTTAFLIWQLLRVLTGQRVLRTASKQEKQ